MDGKSWAAVARTSSPQADASSPSTTGLATAGTDRMIGGVSGGLAEYSGIDPVLWRVGFVGLTVAGGAGIVVYLLLWVLMPSGPLRPGDEPSPLEQMVGRIHARVSDARTTPPRA
ncbi:PspC domain-containing protein [Blastococcus colisei]|uniref:PspC domain-containing protein n=1 Tax=Blastococcus colisei TaxID=1564162 RepID=UPI001FE777F3|nr:PspC domain-containing protein [Blastococcus colisei]